MCVFAESDERWHGKEINRSQRETKKAPEIMGIQRENHTLLPTGKRKKTEFFFIMLNRMYKGGGAVYSPLVNHSRP
jgi:hypothetical protein